MSSLTKVNTEDLQMRGYVDLQQSIFDVKSAIFGKKMPEKVDEPEETEEPSSGNNFKVLTKQSLKLRNTAVLIHKQALMEFKYERRLFGNIKLSNAPKKYQTSATFRKRLKLKKDSEKKLDTSSLRNLIDDLIKKFLRKGWLKIKRGIKRLIGKKGIKFIRSIRKLFRKIKINYKLFRRFAFKPFRQARRFVQSLPKKAWNLSKNLVKKGASVVKTQLLKRGGLKGIKSSATKVIKNTGQMLLKRFKLFYKAGPGKFIKKIPLVGSIIDFAVNYFIFKEPLGKAALKAAGAGIGAWAGGLIGAVGGPLSIAGAIAGGLIGDALGGLLYDVITKVGKGGSSKPVEGAKEGAKVKKPQFVLVGEGGEDEWIVPKSRLGWWIAPLVGDIIQESVDEEKQESAKLKRETNKISEENVESLETSDKSKILKSGKIFDPVIKLSKFFNKESNDTQKNIVNKLKPERPNIIENTVSQNTEPARTTLNNIDPDPEPDYAEVIPGLLESSTIVISQEPQMIPLPIPVMVGGESDESYSVWGRKVVGN